MQKKFYRNTIFLNDDNTLKKLVANDKNFWKRIKNKDLDFINKPLKITSITSKQKKDTGRDCAIIIPYLKDYETFQDFIVPETMTTKDALLIFKDILTKVEQMHKIDLIHGDLTSPNIMIDKENNVKFIDFENGAVDGIISAFNTWTLIPPHEGDIIKYLKDDDIYNILCLFLNYLETNSFNSFFNYFEATNKELLPKNIMSHLTSCMRNENGFPENYYFQDVFDELIKTGYERPKTIN